MSTVSVADPEQLKTEGNALFVKNDFSGAYKKYSDALKHDQKNAILYCNRAACSLGLDRYLDACADATRATELNPAYAKAWARLAAAHMGLARPELVVKAWKRAIAALPKENLSPAEQKQKDHYTRELATAQAKVAHLILNPMVPKDSVNVSMGDQLPWMRGIAMIRGLRAAGQWNSSAWVIANAYLKEWDEGIKGMKQITQVRRPQGLQLSGQRGVISSLSNAVLSDERVFHIAIPNFLKTYNQQVTLETNGSGAWNENGVGDLMELVPKRLAEQGWDSTRYALSLTIRAWIMRAFMEDRLKNDTDAAMQFLTSALEVLRWGAELWKDVPYEDKGAIFKPTFIRGVKCLHLNTFMKGYQNRPGSDSKYRLKELLAGSQSILDELIDAPTEANVDTEDVPFFLSYTRYPAGLAHAAQAFYHNEKAKLLHAAAGGALTDEVVHHFSLTSDAYTKASIYYPPDDETHVWCLHCALHAQFTVGAKVEYMLLMLDSIRRSMPLAKQIWEFSANANWQQPLLAQDMDMRDTIHGIVDRGEARMATILLKTGDNSFDVLINARA